MSYIVQRNQSFYVVAYNGLDPITGAERRRWHPAGVNRSDAEKIQRRINQQTPSGLCERTLAGFMSTIWLRTKTTLTHATRNRYRWMIDHNIAPRIGPLRLDALRPADLDACYSDLIANGGRRRKGLSAKTVSRSTGSSPTRSTSRSTDNSSVRTQRKGHDRPSPRDGRTSLPSGTPPNSTSSSRSPDRNGSTRRSISSPTPACDEANSPD